MQGIFHYTSSLFHAGYMTWMKTYIYELALNQNLYSYTSYMVSSDDSWMGNSIFYEVEEDKVKAGVFALVCSRIKTEAYPLVCAKNSEEKSTSGCFLPICEFNSVWVVGWNIVLITIKFIESATRVGTVSRMDSRLNQFSILRSQLLENSGDIGLVSQVQMCQLYSHYHSLGSYMDTLFPSLAQKLMKNPHPSGAYFFCEPTLACGLLGQNFAFYNSMMRNEHVLRLHMNLLLSEGVELDELAQVKSKLFLMFGQMKKYREFLDRNNFSREKILECFRADPIQFITNPTTREGLIGRIMLKMSDSSISESFTFQTDSKLHASGVYIITSDCLKVINRVEDTTNTEYMSLIRYVNELKPWEGEIDSSSVTVAFPMRTIYDEFIRDLDNIRVKVDSRVGRVITKSIIGRTKNIMKIMIPKIASETPVTLKKAIMRLWFHMPDSPSETVSRSVLCHYQKTFPWLRDTLNDTLNSGGQFNQENGPSLLRFIDSLDSSNKTVRVVTMARSGLGRVNSLISIVKDSQRPGQRLILEEGEEDSEPSETMMSRRGNLMQYYQIRISELPSGPHKAHLLERYFSMMDYHESSPEELISRINMTDAYSRELMILSYCYKHPDLNVINTLMKSSKTGCIGWFDKEQKREVVEGVEKWVGSGQYTGLVDGFQFKIVWNQNSEATLMTDANTGVIEAHKAALTTVFNALKIKPNNRSSNSRGLKERYINISTGDVRTTKTLAQCIPIGCAPGIDFMNFPDNTNYQVRFTEHGNIELWLLGRRQIRVMKLRCNGNISKVPSDRSKLSFEASKRAAPKLEEWEWRWINGIPLPERDSLHFMECLITEEEIDWARETIENRMKHESLYKITPSGVSRANSAFLPNPDLYFDDELDNHMNQSFEDNEDEREDELSIFLNNEEFMTESWVADESSEELVKESVLLSIQDQEMDIDLSFLQEDSAMFMEDQLVRSREISRGVKRGATNPFWDEMLAAMLKYGSNQLLNEIVQGVLDEERVLWLSRPTLMLYNLFK
jgi:hypothetical protein